MKGGNTQEAKNIYLEILETENNNDRILANLSLIYLNNEEFEKCIEFSNKALKVIKSFKEKFNMRKYDNSYEIKLLLRRAKCNEKMDKLEDSQADIEDIERLELKNEVVANEIKIIRVI